MRELSKLVQPKTRIHDLDEFEAYLVKKSVPETLRPLYMDAARHRGAWTHGYLNSAEGLECLVDVFEHSLLEDGGCAWVGPRGQVVYVAHARHEKVAAVFLDRLEEDLEKEWAKVTQSTLDDEQAMMYVRPPGRVTKAMHRAVVYVLAQRGDSHMVPKGTWEPK